nr:phage antirepressor N-terminal domain-containing protein [Neisseria subflava]
MQWEAQFKRIKRNDILNSAISMMEMVAQDGKKRQTLCLPLEYLNGWLFGVDARRVKPQIRERLLQYQRECFQVLAAHFMQPKQPPTVALPAVVTELPTREELQQVLFMLCDRLKEIHNWCDGNVERFFIDTFGKLPHEATYHELVGMIRRLHRKTQTAAGLPMVAGQAESRSGGDELQHHFRWLSAGNGGEMLDPSWPISRIAANTSAAPRRAVYGFLLHEVLIEAYERKRDYNELPGTSENTLNLVLNEVGKLHNLISRVITG